MSKQLNYLAVITARGGSKGIKNKNILAFRGKPLICHTIAAAQNLDRVRCVVSTDSSTIADIARQEGAEVPFIRPAHLATDTANSYDVIAHALDYFAAQGHEFDAVITLQPTSPLRTQQHLKEAIERFDEQQPESLVSVYESPDVNYTKIYIEEAPNGSHGQYGMALSHDRARRQDLPRTYIRNGAIYITAVRYFREAGKIYSQRPLLYPMPMACSVDINEPADLAALTSSNQIAGTPCD